MRRIIVVAIVVFSAGSVRGQGTEPIMFSDLYQIRQLSDVTVSEDDRYVAYVVRSIVEDGDDHGYRSQIWVAAAHVMESPRQLTFAESGASSPNWHPDGDRLAFVRSVDGKSQVFEISIYGGEARQITNHEYGASSPQWSPTGEHLLFSASLTTSELSELLEMDPPWSDERPGRSDRGAGDFEPNPDGTIEEMRSYLDRNAVDSNPRVLTRLNLQGERDLQPESSYNHYFRMDTASGEVELVTRRHYGFSGAQWLPGGDQILLSSYPLDANHPDRVRDRDLFLVDMHTGVMRILLDIESYSLSSPRVSPDGSQIAFAARDLEDPGYAQSELGIFALDGRSAPKLLTIGFDRNVGGVRWGTEDWFLYFTASSEGGVPLYRVPTYEGRTPPVAVVPDEDAITADSLAADSVVVDTRGSWMREDLQLLDLDAEQLTSNHHGIRSFDLAGATTFYVLTEVPNPYELYASPMDFGSPRRVTEHNASWLRTKAISVPEYRTVRRDTLRIPYWVMRPTFQQPNRSYPVLLEIHGGPSAMWGPGEASMWHEFQVMAAQGYGVVYSNPRGSGGYGRAYKAANYQDWGHGPAGDVLAALDEALRRNRWMDNDRQVVTGGSYAGYLTAWIVTQDHRFKAAVAQRGVYDLATFFGEGNAWRLVPSHFGGYPWQEYDILRANSPLTFVDRIRTPLLILHADNDLRTGVIQSEVLYKSLKVRGMPVEYVRYPDAGHELSRSGHPKQRIDRLLRIHEFMQRYIGDSW